MVRNMSRAQREDAFSRITYQMYQALEDWYDEHPNASFGDIEAEARRQRRELMGETLRILVNGRDTGYQIDRPRCRRCGGAMDYKGDRHWHISGLEGETGLMRAYYACPHCKEETFFPPGPETAVTPGSLE